MSVVVVAAQNKREKEGRGERGQEKEEEKKSSTSIASFRVRAGFDCQSEKKSLRIVSAQKGSCFRLTSCVCHHLWRA